MPQNDCKSIESAIQRHRRGDNFIAVRTLIFAALIVGLSADFAHADETGVSLWVAGFFGSLAAAPQTPAPHFLTRQWQIAAVKPATLSMYDVCFVQNSDFMCAIWNTDMAAFP